MRTMMLPEQSAILFSPHDADPEKIYIGIGPRARTNLLIRADYRAGTFRMVMLDGVGQNAGNGYTLEIKPPRTIQEALVEYAHIVHMQFYEFDTFTEVCEWYLERQASNV